MATPPSARNAILCFISLNGGWTADPERNKPARDFGYKMAAALGSYAEYVEEPGAIRPGLGQGRGGHGRLHLGQARPPRPRHDGAFFEPRNLNGRFHAIKGASWAPLCYLR